jgi:predicted Zn-dependent protease with MMP-like domain
MTRERFEVIAQEAFDGLPEKFRERIENVHIVVEDYPSDEVAGQGGRNRLSLLGLYQGVPLTKRGTWYGASTTVPDKITLFQRNIEDTCRNEDEIRRRIIEVLFHEIGHYFGMNEAQIRNAMKNFNP